MAVTCLQQKSRRIARDAKEARMAERYESGVADEHVEGEREDRPEQNLARDVDVIGIADPEGQGREQRQRDGDRGEAQMPRIHGTTLPKRPCGRSTSTSTIGRKKITESRSVNIAWPKWYRNPIKKLPTSAPRRLPVPPRMTTISASGSISLSSPG